MEVNEHEAPVAGPLRSELEIGEGGLPCGGQRITIALREMVMVGEFPLPGRWRQRVAGAATSFVVLGAANGQALASEPFPPVLAEKLGMECVPNCLPCHTEPVGTSDNQRNDGIKNEIETLAAGNVDSTTTLAAALDVLLMNPPNIDSDGDGTLDLAELMAGENPYGGHDLCERPLYGCFASRVSPTLPTRLGALAMALAVSGTLLLRRRRTAR